VGPGDVPTFSNFNGLVCPTGLKATTARKRQFRELSNRQTPMLGVAIAFPTQSTAIEKAPTVRSGLSLAFRNWRETPSRLADRA
jgi:hypothetical protein